MPARPRAALRTRALGALTGAVLILAPLVVIEAGRSSSEPTPRPLPGAVSAAELAARSGVRVMQVAATGGGGLLDLRYQVVDPGRAAAVHAAQTPPALVDERTGLVIHELFMGHQHHGAVKAGVSYYLIFSNPWNIVGRGDRVSVVLGNARLQHVAVR